MFETEIIGGHIVVTGYRDGSEWIFEAWGRAGTAGPDGALLWQISSEGKLATYDIPTRAQLGEAQLGAVESGAVILPVASRNALHIVRKVETDKLARDGRKIVYAEVSTIDLDALEILNRGSYPIGGFDRDVMVMPDDAILITGEEVRYDAQGGSEHGAFFGRIDPATRDFADSFLPLAKIPATYARARWAGHSPDGRWWLRFDHTHFPMVERSRGPGQPVRTYYGLTFQLWSAFPLHFERRIILAWLKAEDLPDATGIYRPWELPQPAPALSPPPAPRLANTLVRAFGRKGLETSPPATGADAAMLASVPARDRLWRSISQGLHRPERDPASQFPDREDFGAEVVTDDILWSAITKNLEDLVRRPFASVGWQPDGEAMWVDMKGFLVCAGMDGHVSPRLWSERFGMRTGMMAPFANAPQIFGICPSRRLDAGELPRPERLGSLEPREGGAFVIDGSAVPEAYEPVRIPAYTDGWRPGTAGLPESVVAKQHVEAVVMQLREDRSIVRIRLDSLDETARAAAILRLAGTLDARFASRAVDSTIDIGFTFAAEVIPEKAFFEAIGPADRLWAVPALRSLIDRFVTVAPRHQTLYQPNDDGLLGQAVLKLVQLDAGALPLVRRYGELMDGGHEHYFPNEIVPGVLEARGWNEATMDFMLWVLIFNFYNSFEVPTIVWRDLGLAEALRPMAPEAAAGRLVQLLGPEVEAGELSWAVLPYLIRCLGDDANAWEIRFFAEMERLREGSTTK
ncbi:hypothetical protein RZN05_02390 [Sphingomonas sp. HF-S4]|uniref:Uncharacterized protein n=1 Tax=Sphingomonas agrestis TaxID=3080540 RepID=A0ABU3Y358_9SPHN|nr:hypothetical protein [Sphingomonas sp. HF-S4]MDV3455818.1 hypothetical protein [Sphingomonas sp. HF-S4]